MYQEWMEKIPIIDDLPNKELHFFISIEVIINED